MAHLELKHRCEGYRDLLIMVRRDREWRSLRTQELRSLLFLLEELAGAFREHSREQSRALRTPVYEGQIDHEYHWSRLINKLRPEVGYDYDQHRVEQLFESCCCALGLVKEFLDQAGGWDRVCRTVGCSDGKTQYSRFDTLRIRCFKLKLDIFKVWFDWHPHPRRNRRLLLQAPPIRSQPMMATASL